MINTHELKNYIKGFDYVLVEYDGSIKSKQLDRDLSIEELQSAVGGFVELLPVEFKGYYIFCNEEGNLINLPANNKASLLLEQFIKGNILFVKKEYVK